MRMKSKYKWSLVGLVFIISLVCMIVCPMLGFMFGFPLSMLSLCVLLTTVCYGAHGMMEARVFERFFNWLNTDDV